MSIKHNNTGFNVELDEKNTCFTTNQLENTIKSITMCIAHLEQNDL